MSLIICGHGWLSREPEKVARQSFHALRCGVWSCAEPRAQRIHACARAGLIERAQEARSGKTAKGLRTPEEPNRGHDGRARHAKA